MLTREHLTLIGADLSSGVEIALVTDKHDGHVWVSVLLDLLEPSGQVCEGVAPCDVVNQKGASCSTII